MIKSAVVGGNWKYPYNMDDVEKINKCPICDESELFMYDSNLETYIHETKDMKLFACNLNKNIRRQRVDIICDTVLRISN